VNLDWEDIRVFLAVAEKRSMSEAARFLRIGQPTVSRRLATLEDRLGYAIFFRTVSGVRLTSAGERLIEPARKMAEWAGEVDRAAGTQDRKHRGVVRLTAPPGVAWDFAAPFAAWLRKKEPGLRIELLSSMSFLDLTRGEADLALRLRAPTQSDLMSVASLRYRSVVMATKAYASRLPKKYSAKDLDWICWAPPHDSLPPNPQLEKLIPNFTPAFTSDNLLVQRQAAEMGVGAIVTGGVRHRFSRASPLVRLNIDLGPAAQGEVHLVCAKTALEISRIRVVAELLAAEFAHAHPSE
jgi:DNA-binding transcriptional LysR family regulator